MRHVAQWHKSIELFNELGSLTETYRALDPLMTEVTSPPMNTRFPTSPIGSYQGAISHLLESGIQLLQSFRRSIELNHTPGGESVGALGIWAFGIRYRNAHVNIRRRNGNKEIAPPKHMLSVTVKRTILIVMPERPVLNLRNGLYHYWYNLSQLVVEELPSSDKEPPSRPLESRISSTISTTSSELIPRAIALSAYTQNFSLESTHQAGPIRNIGTAIARVSQQRDPRAGGLSLPFPKTVCIVLGIDSFTSSGPELYMEEQMIIVQWLAMLPGSQAQTGYAIFWVTVSSRKARADPPRTVHGGEESVDGSINAMGQMIAALLINECTSAQSYLKSNLTIHKEVILSSPTPELLAYNFGLIPVLSDSLLTDLDNSTNLQAVARLLRH
ncbi:hypothetical protein F9C07_2107552 [Aspergillus flavus]|uniref:Uncharacterized protein n=1 Tax=Aspergillus flavus (strain ATCC 200026 / FGSC A1120 / IAM 13836 / NRRL 3357 / JCM 12722 / SRRC 167) TaxID=332952 RepID=A0A7U2MH44_ASPFN|nr:hypothetical protein F9C07_2107552 [Aspergillus flavus]